MFGRTVGYLSNVETTTEMSGEVSPMKDGETRIIPSDRIMLSDPTHVCMVVRDVEKTAAQYASFMATHSAGRFSPGYEPPPLRTEPR